MPEFVFAGCRNEFADAVDAETGAKKGRSEVNLQELSVQDRDKFVGDDGNNAKEWQAWLDFKAAEPMSVEESAEIQRSSPHLIVPSKWVRTKKNEDAAGPGSFQAKSRLMVQGFTDPSVGQHKSDAPTASRLAEAFMLSLVATMRMRLVCGDITNANFSGKPIGREVYIKQPQGGLPQVPAGALLRVRSAISGFSEAARLFWLAVKEAFEEDGWLQSRLEPALFYKYDGSGILGIACTHVDDVLGGIIEGRGDPFEGLRKKFQFKKWEHGDFVFRGRHHVQSAGYSVEVDMRDYARKLTTFKIGRDTRKDLGVPINDAELQLLQKCTGELSWLARQLCVDLTYRVGYLQRSRAAPCVGDMVLLRHTIRKAKKGADIKLKYAGGLDAGKLIVLTTVDAGHAKGHETIESIKYKSCGGHVVMLSDEAIMAGGTRRCLILDWLSHLTQRVCRSTLAAEASHLASAMEITDWVAMLLCEFRLGAKCDLRAWPRHVESITRIWVTDARSVYDHLMKESVSSSKDKRMAIEAALLRETVSKPTAHLRWTDGSQNVADVLTKLNVDDSYFLEFLRTAKWTLVQDPLAAAAKERKREARRGRKVQVDDKAKEELRAARRAAAVREILTMVDESG